MYIASVTAEEQAAFTPQLNHEHSEYKWWDVAALVNADTQPALHPVVDLLLQVQLLWPAQHTSIRAAQPSWQACLWHNRLSWPSAASHREVLPPAHCHLVREDQVRSCLPEDTGLPAHSRTCHLHTFSCTTNPSSAVQQPPVWSHPSS